MLARTPCLEEENQEGIEHRPARLADHGQECVSPRTRLRYIQILACGLLDPDSENAISCGNDQWISSVDDLLGRGSVPSYLPFLLILLAGLASLQVAYVTPSSSRGAEVTNETTTTTDTSYGTTWTSTPPVHATSSLPLHPSDQGLAVGSEKALNRTRGTPVSGFWNATHGTGALPTVVPAASKAGVSVAGALPGMFSWNGFTGGTNWMTPIENQGNCGSCWAFAPVGAMEAQYQIQIGNSNTGIDLSEQNLLSCTPPPNLGILPRMVVSVTT